MKRIAFISPTLLVMYLLPVLCFSQGTRNFIKEWTATAPETDPNNLMARPLSDAKLSTMYFDGLGRPQQSVVKKGSLITSTGASTDVVTPFEYDEFGREIKKYLPYVAGTNDGLYKDNAFPDQLSFNQSWYSSQSENTFYAKTDYESSPLNRVIKQMAPGASWAGNNKGVAANYWINTVNDAVRIWNVTDVTSSFGTYSSPSTYPAGELYKNVTVDENSKQVIEFKDKKGEVILKKVQLTAAYDDGTVGADHSGWLCTYYIYDDFGRLRCVIQPKAVEQLAASGWQLTQSQLDELCFRYEYDARGRMIMKKVPGAGEVYLVYDAKDRLVMTQDANLRISNKWLITLYDNLDRPEETGLLLNTWNSLNYSFTQHLSAAAASSSYPFTSSTVPSATYWEELTHSFYDNYDWRSNYGNPLTATYDATYDSYFQTTSNFPYPQANVKSDQLKNLVTGIRRKVIGTSTYLFTVNFYDAKGRLIQSQSQNLSNGTDIITTQYTWAGQPLVNIVKTEKAGTPNAQTSVIVSQMTYDDLGRIVKIEKKLSNTLVNSGAMSAYKTIVQNEYDALGHLTKKKLAPAFNSNAGLETENFDYNIRGWLLGMNRDYAKDANNTYWFGFDLGYDKANNGIIGNQTYSNPQFNGNIEGMVWKSKGDGEKRRYDFYYDAANRLLRADFTQYTSGSFNQNAGVNFNVKMGDGVNVNSAYDANGNILQMQQWGLKITGSTQVDNLAYVYQTNSNKLAKVTDANNDPNTKLGDFHDGINGATDDYSYDVNGNLTLDNNKSISSITYNYLNLPSVITVIGKGTISYTYDASGNKLKKVTTENNAIVLYNGTNYTSSITTTTTYIGGLVYESKSYSNSSLTSMNYTDVLQFITHEEGRIRALKDLSNNVTGFAYDYFLKDHLGNVRMVLTEEQRPDFYPAATLEGTYSDANTAVGYEKGFYSIDQTKIVNQSAATGITAYQNNNGISNPYPNGNSGNTIVNSNSQKLYQLNANANKTGLGILLKVMNGDVINIFGKSYYFQNNSGDGPNNNLAVLDIANGLLASPGGSITSSHGVVSANDISNIAGTSITGFLTTGRTSYTSSVPRAYINYLILDEQFKFVAGNFSSVGSNSVVKDHHNDPSMQNIQVTKNGYIYIYVSNESPVNVFFDNLQVVHTRGPLVEETHYYPFGLTMAGISSKTLNFGVAENKRLFNGKQLENKEFSDGSGLEWYDYGMREYNQQIGRFFRVDPLTEKFYELTPYQYASNNPVTNIDLDGLEGIFFQDAINWAISKVVENPNSGTSKTIGAVVGVGQSVQKTLTGAVNLIVHPYESGKAILNMNTPEGMLNMAIDVAGKVSTLQNGTGFEKAAVISEAVTDVATIVVGTKGLGAGVKGAETASVVAEATTSSKSAVSGLNLGKKLASEAQMSEAGVPIAGAGTSTPLRKAGELAKEYGGQASDYAKKSSSSYTAKDGTKFSTHWEENVKTGQRVNIKTKLKDD